VAGETIALSVSLLNTRGDIFLGWPIKLEWSSSDPSIATVNGYGIVDVHTRGRVELTCTCEGKTGSVLLTVVEPAVAIAVGLPVPARLRTVPLISEPVGPVAPPSVEPVAATPTAAATAPVPTTLDELDERADEAVVEAREQSFATTVASASPTESVLASKIADAPTRPQPRVAVPSAVQVLATEPAPVYRRSVERGSVRHSALPSLPLSRGARQVLFRIAVGAATGAIIAIVLTRSPEDVFFVETEPSAGVAGSTRAVVPVRSTVARADVRPAASISAPVVLPSLPTPTLADTAAGTALGEPKGRVVSEAAGSAALAQPVSNASTPAVAVTAAAPPPPAVARVVLASSPSQLTEGESVRLSAAGVDDRGSAMADRSVTWKSENEDVAVVDPDGVVTAKRPGSVTIVATSEGRSGRVTLSVGARPAPAPSREFNAAAAMQVIRARVDEFVTALRERNGSRVASLYNAELPQDRKNLQALLERLRRPEARLKATDPALGASEIREMEAAVEFQVAMSWTTPFGRVRNQTSTFRAVLEPGDGGWRLVAIRALGKVD
jgi:hypothetical protein